MSYLAQSQLETDVDFQRRVRACVIEQAETFKDDGRRDIAATARACLRDEAGLAAVFIRLAAGAPGMGDRVDNSDGTIDQGKVTDADILTLVQNDFPVVAELYYSDDGSRLERMQP
jgi:hypothetical protein